MSVGAHTQVLLAAAASRLETPAGRRLFWAAVVIFGLVFGFLCVMRAEFPKRKKTPTPHYLTPLDVGESEDAQAKWSSSEFRAFRRIGWGVVHGGINPYTDLRHVRAYPPFFGIAFYPFCIPWRVPGLGSGLFNLISFGFMLLTARCVSRALAPAFPSSHALFAFCLILLAPLAFDVMVRCESDLLILYPIALAFQWIVQGRRRFSAGMLLGFAASFKVLPGLFGLYLICTRQWKALAGMMACGVLCTVILPAVVFGPQRAVALHRSWLDKVANKYIAGGAAGFLGDFRASNQSMAACVNRLLAAAPPRMLRPAGQIEFNERADRRINLVSLSPTMVRGVVKALQLLILGGLVVTWVLCSRRTSDPRTAAMLMGAVAPGILLLSEVSLTTHHVLLILPLGALLVRLMAPDDPAAARWAWVFPLYLLGLILVGIPLTKPYTPLFPVTLCTLAACVTVAWERRGAQASGSRLAPQN